MVVFFILFFAGCAQAAAVDEDQAMRAVIGEASSEGYKGMLAVACAIRNRGTLQGVYGVKAKHVDREPAWVWDLARKAWRESAQRDITNGATHWENIQAFGKPNWAEGMIETGRIGRHVFYKEVVRNGRSKRSNT